MIAIRSWGVLLSRYARSSFIDGALFNSSCLTVFSIIVFPTPLRLAFLVLGHDSKLPTHSLHYCGRLGREALSLRKAWLTLMTVVHGGLRGHVPAQAASLTGEAALSPTTVVQGRTLQRVTKPCLT